MSQKRNLIIALLYIERNQNTHVCASSLTASKTKRVNLTWLPSEIMHCGHTRHDYPWPWHDYPWPWHDYCIICSYDVTGTDFENSLYAFSQSEKRQWVQCIIISFIVLHSLPGPKRVYTINVLPGHLDTGTLWVLITAALTSPFIILVINYKN